MTLIHAFAHAFGCRSRLIAPWIVIAGLPAAGCSLALDFSDNVPCSTDADCPYTAGPGACIDGFCRPPGSTAADTGTTTFEPTGTDSAGTTPSDSTTQQADSTSTTDATTGPISCTRHSECAMDQRCSTAGTCMDLLSAECQIVRWPARGRDNVMFIGSIFATSEPFTNVVQPIENAVQLAIDDFNAETTLQGDRGVAWVGCDEASGPDAEVAAAQHLVNNVEVPVIIGPTFSEAVIDVAEQVAVSAGTMVISPTATAVNITNIDDNGLVWRTIADDVYQSNALVDRMVDLDAVSPVSNLLILAKDDVYGNGILTDILPDLQSELPDAEIYHAVYADPTSFASMEELLSNYGAVIAGAAVDPAGQPYYTHVIFIGTSEIQALLYAYLGTVWAPVSGTEPMPSFTVTHGAVTDMARFIEELGAAPGTEALAAAKPLLETKLQGISPIVLNPVNFMAFSIRYQIAFNDQQPLTGSALGYDAALAAIFAAATIPSEDEITGATLAAAMGRLADLGGTMVSFSGSDLSFISAARNALVVEGGSVDLQGVSGELQWNLTTGDVRANVWGWDVVDPTPDGSDPNVAFTRVYTLNPEPATDGVWSDL